MVVGDFVLHEEGLFEVVGFDAADEMERAAAEEVLDEGADLVAELGAEELPHLVVFEGGVLFLVLLED